ncbi:MAG: endonuclease/exonuclease/phosphatase family protein, partial [Oscillospiraceae bacterium]|nr:endonuclease/exonuclease/phosphatase family protein [Oscillospiraceae bacterium]
MKQRCLALFVAIACLLSLFSFGVPVVVEAQAASDIPDILLYEDYSSSKEFRISTCYGLQKFSQLGQSTNFSGVTFYLVADIDMSGISYTPVSAFSGTFDGGYHVIERLSVSTTNKNCGLFDTVNAAGVVRRLGLEGCTFSISSNHADHRVGSFAGVVKGLVEECWSTSVLTATASGSVTDLSVGGIAGALINGGIAKNCYFAGRATGVDHASGISDWCQGHYEGYVGQIINCFNIGTLSATTCYALGRYSGKILAENKPNAILNSFYCDNYTVDDWATNAKKVSKSYLGSGYMAYLLNTVLANNTPVWSKGAMFPELRGEGGVYCLKVTYDNKGYSSTATMYYNAGDTYTVQVPTGTAVTLTPGAGTVSGNTFTMPAQNTTLTVSVDLPNVAQYTTYPNAGTYVITNTAGFTAMATAVNGGKTFSGKSIYMLGDIDMNNATHTPIGQFVSDSSWTKSFSGTFYGNNFKVFNLKVSNTSLNGGGLFGSCYKSTIIGLHIFNGSVTTANRAGGITGYADGGCTFRYCSNGADIKTTTGKDGAGGLAGVARNTAKFQYCANYGSVTATANAAAGIAGWGQTNIQLTGCINTGVISAPDDYAALARVGSGFSGTWSDCYYLKSACSTSASGSSKDESNFCTGIIGGSINTVSRTVANNGAYTNTPRFPAICTENEAPATCTRLYAYDNGVTIGYTTIYANVGDRVSMTNSQDYYSASGHSVTADLTNKAYPTGILYDITYVLNGGTFTDSATTTYTYAPGASLPLESQVQKNGAVFAGWYESSALTGQVNAVVGPNARGDKTYYAKWSTLVEINNVDDYLAFVKAVNAGNSYSDKVVRITADLDFGGKTVSALGTASAPFCGVLDGMGHSLSNFTVSGSDAQGLVGYLKQGTVQYIKLNNCTVSGKINVGTVVGYNDNGLVLGCESAGTVVNQATLYDLSYMSFNIRCGEDPSPNTVSERTPRVKTYLANYSPDIIGLQEVTPTWKTVLSSALSGYSSEFVYRGSSSQEAAPLYWKSGKFNALEQGTFWLSETPDKISYGWGATYYRTCSYAVLQPKNTNVIILAYNTHLDHQSTQAQIEGIKLVKSRMDTMETKYRNKGYTEIYSFVTGDFNAKPTTEAGSYLSKTMVEARNAAVSLGTPLNQNTFSAYNANPTSIIDYIFVSRNVDVKTYKVTLDKINGNAISDHYGLYGTMRLGGNAQGGVVGYNKGNVQSCAFTGSIDSQAGTAGIAGYNAGKIVGSYSKFTPKVTEVFNNGIASKVEGSVFFSYYPSNAGLSGSGSTTADMTATSYLTTLNRPLKLWSMDKSVNNGLPFICLKHEFIYKDNGNNTHTGSCALCGATTTEEHKAVTDQAVAPTCTLAGKTEGSHCELCGLVFASQTELPATGHSYSAKVTMEAGCTSAGVRSYTCNNCGHSYTEEIEPTGHSYTSAITTAPTCTATGIKTFSCENCTHRYTEVVPAVGHTPVIDEAVAPSCLSSGKTEGSHCDTCGATLVAQTAIPRLGHDYVYTNIGDGKHVGVCSRCEKSQTSEHQYTDGSCICGDLEAKEPQLNTSLKLYHSLNLASDISVNFAIPAAYLKGFDMDSVYVETRYYDYVGNELGEEKVIRLDPVLNGSYYYFTLEGLTAIHMTNELSSVLYGTKDGQPYYSPVDEYSIATYAYSQLTSTTAAA